MKCWWSSVPASSWWPRAPNTPATSACCGACSATRPSRVQPRPKRHLRPRPRPKKPPTRKSPAASRSRRTTDRFRGTNEKAGITPAFFLCAPQQRSIGFEVDDVAGVDAEALAQADGAGLAQVQFVAVDLDLVVVADAHVGYIGRAVGDHEVATLVFDHRVGAADPVGFD